MKMFFPPCTVRNCGHQPHAALARNCGHRQRCETKPHGARSADHPREPALCVESHWLPSPAHARERPGGEPSVALPATAARSECHRCQPSAPPSRRVPAPLGPIAPSRRGTARPLCAAAAGAAGPSRHRGIRSGRIVAVGSLRRLRVPNSISPGVSPHNCGSHLGPGALPRNRGVRVAALLAASLAHLCFRQQLLLLQPLREGFQVTGGPRCA